jgi:deoxyribose-phosphate aldolase
MRLTPQNIAAMIDLSCVRTDNTRGDIEALVGSARQYAIGQVTVLQAYIPLVKQLLAGQAGIRLSGNVSFPAGADATALKVIQACQLVEDGCDEIDMVMNVGLFLSREYAQVQEDIQAVVQATSPLPVKVIIEMAYLTPEQVAAACELCIAAGAAFIKTGTGWIGDGTTVADIQLIKSIVGERIQIKASGGIRDLDTLVEMYRQGARRFGVNLKSGVRIVADCAVHPEKLVV